MTKIEIAKELLKNTTNIHLKSFIKDYITDITEKKVFSEDRDDLIRFDNCISFIEKVAFEIIDWQLFEIPIFYSHCFLNEKKNQAFDLAVWDIGEVIPRYIKDSNEHDAKSIEEAIEKYEV